MQVQVQISMSQQVQVPEGARLRVEVRDLSARDQAWNTVTCQERPVSGELAGSLLPFLFPIDSRVLDQGQLLVWAHLSIDGSSAVNGGDFVTTLPYLIRSHDAPHPVCATLMAVYA